MQPFAICLIARQHGAEIEWPVLEAEDAQKAVLCFTDAKLAHDYLHGHSGQPPGWSVVQMEWDEFLRWLRSNLFKGVHLLVFNPKSNEPLVRALPLFQFLVEMEGTESPASLLARLQEQEKPHGQ